MSTRKTYDGLRQVDVLIDALALIAVSRSIHLDDLMEMLSCREDEVNRLFDLGQSAFGIEVRCSRRGEYVIDSWGLFDPAAVVGARTERIERWIVR